MNILIIEDDKPFANVIETLFTRWGHTVFKSLSGKSAVRMMNPDIDLVLLDLFLPDTMGYDLIPKIRALSPETKIITMTGTNCRNLEDRIRSQGILYYMLKPFEIKYLKCIVEHIAQKKTGETQKNELEAINE